jgi:hypothetical protein
LIRHGVNMTDQTMPPLHSLELHVKVAVVHGKLNSSDDDDGAALACAPASIAKDASNIALAVSSQTPEAAQAADENHMPLHVACAPLQNTRLFYKMHRLTD